MPDIVQLKKDGVAKYLKTHADVIDGVDGKLIRVTGNETILGTKNFQDGMQVVDRKPVLTKTTTDYAMADRHNDTSITSDGSLKLYRRGDLVYPTGSFKLSAGKYSQGVWLDIPLWSYPIEFVRMYGKSGDKVCLLSINLVDNNNIVCVDSIVEDSWITVLAYWMARDPY